MKKMKFITALVFGGVVFLGDAWALDAERSAITVSPKTEGNTSLNYPWEKITNTITWPVSVGGVSVKLVSGIPFLKVGAQPWQRRTVSEMGGITPKAIRWWNASSRWNWDSKEYEAIVTKIYGDDATMCGNSASTSRKEGVKKWAITATGHNEIHNTVRSRSGCGSMRQHDDPPDFR